MVMRRKGYVTLLDRASTTPLEFLMKGGARVGVLDNIKIDLTSAACNGKCWGTADNLNNELIIELVHSSGSQSTWSVALE